MERCTPSWVESRIGRWPGLRNGLTWTWKIHFPLQSTVQGKNPLSQPAAHTEDAAQHMVGFWAQAHIEAGSCHSWSDWPELVVVPDLVPIPETLCTPITCAISFPNCLQFWPATFPPLHPPVTTPALVLCSCTSIVLFRVSVWGLSRGQFSRTWSQISCRVLR